MAEEPRFPLEKVGPSAMHSVISDTHVAGNDGSDLDPRGRGRGDLWRSHAHVAAENGSDFDFHSRGRGNFPDARAAGNDGSDLDPRGCGRGDF